LGGVTETPSKDDLAKVTNLDSIDLSNNRAVYDLEPLRKLLKLQTIVLNKTMITDLAALEAHREIRFLDISDTEVKDLSVASHFIRLKALKADRTKIEKLDPLYGIESLEKLYVDLSGVHDITVREFLEHNPKCLVVHKTNHLNRWWRELSGYWKDIFRAQMKDTTSTRENLHRLVEQERLEFKDVPVRDLAALSEFVRLQELHFSGTAIVNITAPENLASLKSLHATNSPLQRIEALEKFSELEDLDISNTPVDDLKPVERLQKLRIFNGAGTQIKKLDPLERLQTLESVDCSNTRVGNLEPVMYMGLKTLKCYNTKVSDRDIRNFRERNPECNVVYYR
jgi:Leucine-rich repeat (LRR) protein